jgi:hypothetical protein
MNVEMMLKVADVIEKHPELYNQREWCDTECCIAGHTLALHYGIVPALLESRLAREFRNAFDLAIGFYPSGLPYRRLMTIVPQFAAEILNLEGETSNTLFGSGCDWPQPFTLGTSETEFRVYEKNGVRWSLGSSKAAAYIRFLVQQYQEHQRTRLYVLEAVEEICQMRQASELVVEETVAEEELVLA